MKKLLPLLLISALLLAACGSVAPPAQHDPLPVAAEQATPAPSPAEDTKTEEYELPVLGDAPLTAPREDVPLLGEETVTLDGLDSYLRLTLPEGWAWEQAAGTVDGTVCGLWPEADPDFKVELHFWPTKFAMCGTGVTFQDYTLPSGEKASLAYERIGEEFTWILILPEAPDSFTIQFAGPYSLYETHRQELELLLSTLQQGILAHPDVVQPQSSMD